MLAAASLHCWGSAILCVSHITGSFGKNYAGWINVFIWVYLKKKERGGGKRNNNNNSFGACFCPHFSLLKHQFGIFNSPLLDCFKKLGLLTKDKECNLMEVKSAYSVNLGFIIPVTRLATVLKPFWLKTWEQYEWMATPTPILKRKPVPAASNLVQSCLLLANTRCSISCHMQMSIHGDFEMCNKE